MTNKGTRKDPACMKSGFSVCLEKRRNSHHMEEVYFPKTARRTDAFTLADYTSQCVAEQLTLIEQGIFQMTHPVHYLNSKALGVSVALTMSGARTPSIMRLAFFIALVILYSLIQNCRIKFSRKIEIYSTMILFMTIFEKKYVGNVVWYNRFDTCPAYF